MNLEEKKVIRKQIIEHRDSIDSSLRREWDKTIFFKLINSEFYKNANMIFTFVSFKSEVDTHSIIKHSISCGKTICVPRIKSKQNGIEIYKINGFEDLKEGYFGILEPIDTCLAVDKDSIDLILMPGVAFDSQGGRLGYGAGYYDRFIASMSKKVDKIALAYNFQIIDKVPMDTHDIKIDGIITEMESIII